MVSRLRFPIAALLAFASASLSGAAPPPHSPFKVAIYIPVGVVEQMKDPAYLEKSWNEISSQVKVDKVYIESYRSGVTADDRLLEHVKNFFAGHGVEVAGGIAYAAGGDSAGFAAKEVEPGQFVSMSYTDPKQRAFVKHVAEITARHFDEIILDDFFFNNTKRDSDIAAKGAATWTDFRLKLMDDVARNLVVAPARAINPNVKIIIKFPNWYEHFQANGYDLDQEPKIFDGIYTGTETRDPVITDQHLQQYESYLIVRYFDNIAPDHNGGGWVDTYDTRYIDRYAEQLWDTMLAKTPEIMLFQYSDLLRPAALGDRKKWELADTSFNSAGLDRWHTEFAPSSPVTWLTAAGYALSTVSTITGKLGKPIGIASYKPCQSTGEDFLHNYLGMIGIPIDLDPEFPADTKTVLLTESAEFDPQIVSKIDEHLKGGGNVIVTSGLLRALQDKGFQQIAEIHATGDVLRVNAYWGAIGAGGGVNLGATSEILIPEIAFMTNDAWPVVRGTANGRGAPLLLMERYSKGILFVLTIPENPSDLYALPQPVLTQIKHYLMSDFPFQMDAPAKVSLFAYDNESFVVESYLDEPAQIHVLIQGSSLHLKNLTTGEVVEGKTQAMPGSPRADRPPHTEFKFVVNPHSLVAFVEQ